MTEKFTKVTLPGQSAFRGILEHGEQPVEVMVKAVREHADWLRAELKAIDHAADEDFKVDVVRGSIVQHHVRSLQPGRR